MFLAVGFMRPLYVIWGLRHHNWWRIRNDDIIIYPCSVLASCYLYVIFLFYFDYTHRSFVSIIAQVYWWETPGTVPDRSIYTDTDEPVRCNAIPVISRAWERPLLPIFKSLVWPGLGFEPKTSQSASGRSYHYTMRPVYRYNYISVVYWVAQQMFYLLWDLSLLSL
jgi:hypothetical protein